jgi:hypothetical protein
MMLDFSYALLKSGVLNYVISKFEDYKDDDFYNEVSRIFESYSKKKKYLEVYESSYENLVGSGKQYQSDAEFFYALLQNAKSSDFILAVDAQAYTIVVCKYIKIFLTDITEKTAYTLYKASLDRIFFEFVYAEKIRSHDFIVKLYNEGVAQLSKEEFIQLYNETTITGNAIVLDTLRQEAKAYTSTEYKIASLLSTGSNEFDDDIRKYFRKQIADYLLHLAIDLRLLYAYDKYVFDNENDVLNIVHSSSVYDPLDRVKASTTDVILSSLTANADEYDALTSRYFMTTLWLKKSQVEERKDVSTLYTEACALANMPSALEMINYIVEFIKENEYCPYIDYDVSKINPILLRLVFNAYINNDVAMLKELSYTE